MRKRQENKFAMYNTTDSYLSESQVIVESINELNAHHQDFKAKLTAIKSKNDEKKNAIMGKAVSKLMARDNVIKSSIKVSAGLYAYAKRSRNIELAEISNVHRSDLGKMRDTELVDGLEALRDLAYSYIRSLETFGVTAAKFDEFKNKITEYDIAVGRSQTGMVRRKGAGKSLTILFTEADDVLVTLDKLVNGLNDEHPEFVRMYNDARLINNLGIRHRKEEIVIPPESGTS